MTFSDTVAAVGTPFGKGGIAVIRISGEDAVAVAARLFRPASGRAVEALPSHVTTYGRMVDPGDPTRELDDGMCTVFRAPHSFTGEDTVELSCHGGVLVTRRVLAACFAAGARQAVAGEFTRRAYLNGKLGLEQAEALGNLLDAGNEEQVSLARAGMKGYLGEAMDGLYDHLCGVLANLEAGMDFPEEDLTEMTRDELIEAVTAARRRVTELMATYRTGHAIAEGVPTVICGRPNVGKSALYNRLVGREAAIVTDVPGTTRDVLSDTVSCGRVTLRLADTAGLRETDDKVERIGIDRARAAMEDAELILALFDPTAPDPSDAALIADLIATGKTVVWILTKADAVGEGEGTRPTGLPEGYITLSARTGQGMDALTQAVEAAFIDGHLRTEAEAVVFSARQQAALSRADADLSRALEDLQFDITYDICAEDIREAMSALAELCGRSVREDVIGEIFARFCVGK